MASIAFVLRGRPGLGHVTPGLAIAQAVLHAGHRAKIITYQNGAKFLQQTLLFDWCAIEANGEYHDWPGLSLYPHGVRYLMPLLEKENFDYLVLGGEYFLAPISQIMDIKTAIIMNPETFRKKTHNNWFKGMLLYLINHCSLLFSTSPWHSEVWANMGISAYLPIIDGPFVLEPDRDTGCCGNTPFPGRVILIANGGGCDFPLTTRSYAVSETMAKDWRAITYEMTKASIAAAMTLSTVSDLIYVFSCLSQEENQRIQNDLSTPHRVRVCQPSMDYYRVLRSADIIISRVGAGFVADAITSSARVVIWSLPGHVEQTDLAERVVRLYPNFSLCNTPDEMNDLLRTAFSEMRRDRLIKQRSIPNHASTAAAAITKHL